MYVRDTHQLGGVFAPGQVADLRPSINNLHGLARQRVPEANVTVSRPSTTRQQAVVMGRPGNGCSHTRVLVAWVTCLCEEYRRPGNGRNGKTRGNFTMDLNI